MIRKAFLMILRTGNQGAGVSALLRQGVRAPAQPHLAGVAGDVEATRRAQLLDFPRPRNRQALRLRRDRIGRVVGEYRAD